jgi:polar amino acid transport system permease protein
MPFDWKFAWQIMPALSQGAVITIEATILSFCVATILGLIFAIGKRSRINLIRVSIIAFTGFVRSTPLLVQLYFLYFILPLVNIILSPLVTGVIGLGVHYSCYTAEAYRAGIESVAKGQWEAAIALNYTRLELFRRIILPQAIPPTLPALGNYLIAMFKDTPLLAAITVTELMQTANVIASEKFLYVEPMTIVGLIFLVISLVASRGLRKLERLVK